MDNLREKYPMVLLVTGLSGSTYFSELSRQVDAALKDFKGINASLSSDVEMDGIMKFHSIDDRRGNVSNRKSASSSVLKRLQTSFILGVKELICENFIPSIERLNKVADDVYVKWKTIVGDFNSDASKAMLEVHGTLWNRLCGFGVVRHLLVILARIMKATLPRLSSFDVIAQCIRSPADFPVEMWMSQLEILQTVCGFTEWSSMVSCLVESWVDASLLILALPGSLSKSQLKVIAHFLTHGERKCPPKSVLICYLETLRVAVKSKSLASTFPSMNEWLLESQWPGFLLRLWHRLVLVRCTINEDKVEHRDCVLNSLFEEAEQRQAAKLWTYQILLDIGWTSEERKNKKPR